MKGYRTYAVAIAIGIAAAVHQLGYIDNHLYQTIIGVLGGGGLAFLRAAVPTKK